jgi:ATP-dependent helicase YprA (DUF1998 family)/very-short-patch-repair endonuclease
MDVFQLHRKIIEDYSSFIQSFIQISDERIDAFVQDTLKSGQLWPEPLIQLNPSFEPGGAIDDLVREGVLHKECSRIFRIKKDLNDIGKPLKLHKHQAEAIYAAQQRENYVLTTGTGSGKSLSYIVPIVNHVLKNGSGKGIQAIIVYPMNALANSQFGELEKFLCYGYPEGENPVTFQRYTGQESEQEKNRIIQNPPDILITNYVMLELILTRVKDRALIRAAKDLRFLVFDELHTYRGRQGADVAMLIRRLRDKCGGDLLQCIGTSATMAGEGTYDQQREEVARVASQLFGTKVKKEYVIGETLRRATPSRDLSDPVFISELRENIEKILKNGFPNEPEKFINEPLSIWIESVFGLQTEEGTGRLIRTKPRSISGDHGAAKLLSQTTGLPEETCVNAIQSALLAGYQRQNPNTGFPIFAFRLHAFISRGDTVYASLEEENKRYLTLEGQHFVPKDRERVLLPLCFCRECGQEYYVVRKLSNPEKGEILFTKRELNDLAGDEEGKSEAGFLYFSSKNPWPSNSDSEIIDRLPDDWLENSRKGLKIKRDRAKYLPRSFRIASNGKVSEVGLDYQFVSAPFRFCLNCGIAYGSRNSSDFSKLATLGSEGRSTATTILSLSAIRHLKNEDLPAEAKKLLSFTDNRQDASLQAGHFNDFVEIGLLRSALYKAIEQAGENGLDHDELTQEVFKAMNLPIELYASNPEVRFAALKETEQALRDVIGYRLYQDLRRGWRITAPNLEQCGLLEIKYSSLEEVCEAEDVWVKFHPALVTATPKTREKVAKVLLDYMRRELAIKVPYLDQDYQERIKQRSSLRLIEPWAIDENERMEFATVLYPRSRTANDFLGNVFLSERSGFGQYLRRHSTFVDYVRENGQKISQEDTKVIINQLLEALTIGGIVEQVDTSKEIPGYQINASSMKWVAGDGTKAFHDPIRIPNMPKNGGRTNKFFVNFYKTLAMESRGINAREHTAQVPSDVRLIREKEFREGKLPILYCSPTMELGVDISQLNVVNMRNIPPTPANYAQRSGRAGRSGQPALVFSYCSLGSNHDQYFFKHPQLMVAGVVTPPRLDLTNEDLIISHIHAIWLEETQLDLGTSLKDILDLSGENPTLELLPSIKESVNDESAKNRAFQRTKRVLESLKDIVKFSDEQIMSILNNVPLEFNKACDRWRGLYKAALKQRSIQDAIIIDATRSAEDKTQAKRLRREAEAQLDLLLESENITQSDFYSYRYFASEGFLPGYNFPRLPLSAYIPGKRRGKERDEFLSRARFLAISEFGPRSIVYHEGSRYIINKVILPVGEGKEELATSNAKICPSCGYLHPLKEGSGPDLCERCNEMLEPPLKQLFRLENVATKRRDRINSDEEERLRQGYEIKTVVRFAQSGNKPSYQVAEIKENGNLIATLTYGHAATLWRINLGWSRRKEKEQYGFVLDLERGYWAKNEQSVIEEDDSVERLSSRTARVIPYVEDRRNCLLFKPEVPLTDAQLASLQSALKNAIQVQFQLEDNELAAEPLPDIENRRLILLYESAEGGAGVLRRFIDDPASLKKVAKTALELCHFNPETGEDLGKAPNAKEECEAACYYCLMNYSNQKDHPLLDRKVIRDLLYSLQFVEVLASPTHESREDHLSMLMRQTESDLERDWLNYLVEKGYNLPSHAQLYIPSCKTRPDFVYEDKHAVVFIDGPHHDYSDRQERDILQTEALEDQGYTVIRFSHDEDWDKKIQKYSYIFGRRPS